MYDLVCRKGYTPIRGKCVNKVMVVRDIDNAKNKLMTKAKKSGLYEDFGQTEIRQIKDKYDYTSLVRPNPIQWDIRQRIDDFIEWAPRVDDKDVKDWE